MPLDRTTFAPGFSERIQAYMIKAVREAKQHTAWLKPDETYENGIKEFVKKILDSVDGKDFLEDFLPLDQKSADDVIAETQTQDILKGKFEEFAKELNERELKIFEERLLAELPG